MKFASGKLGQSTSFIQVLVLLGRIRDVGDALSAGLHLQG